MKKSSVSILFLLILAACSAPAQPTATPAPLLITTPLATQPATLAPTGTSLPSAETPDALSSLAPEGTPASEWSGIPIMPEAIAGEGDPESYVFTVKATPQQVQDYYDSELGKLGWQSLGQGPEGNSLVLVFTDTNSATLTISILTKGDQTLVLLVK